MDVTDGIKNVPKTEQPQLGRMRVQHLPLMASTP
jgi:hypothetical protein